MHSKPQVLKLLQSLLLGGLLLGIVDKLRASPGPGTVTFGNNNSALLIDASTGAPIASTNGVQAALYWSPLGSNTFIQIGPAVPVGVPVPGIFAGGTRTCGSNTVGSAQAQFRVRAWGGGYPTFEQAATNGSGILIGQSAIIQAPTGDPGAAPPLPPTSLFPYGLHGFTLSTNGLLVLTLSCSTSKTVPCGTNWVFDPPTASTSCLDSNITIVVLNTVTNGNCPQVVTRTWLATDTCGESNTCSQAVTIVDITPPSVTCVPDKTVVCGVSWNFDLPSGFDDCSGTNVSLAVVKNETNGVCPQLFTRTWRATDLCGNTNFCSQTVTVVDTNPPSLTCGPNKTVQCGSAWSFDPPIASDTCRSGTNIIIATLDTITNGVCPTLVTRTWSATDLCGNSNVCSQVVSVIDTVPPTIVCAPSKTVNCNDGWDFDVPSISDACAGSLNLSALSTVTNGICPQVATRVWQVTDACGNSNTCSQTVTIFCAGSGNPGIAVFNNCPTNPVPPGGLLVYTGFVTNAGDTLLTNILVLSDQPVSNSVVFGPAALGPGESAAFSGRYFVTSCSCGPYAETLTAVGSSPCGPTVTNFVVSSCPGTNSYKLPGDFNGDGIVDQFELNIVLTNYFKTANLTMARPTKLNNGLFQVSLTNANAWTFTVLASGNLVDWTNLPDSASPIFQFTDPVAATNAPARFYRLRYP